MEPWRATSCGSVCSAWVGGLDRTATQWREAPRTSRPFFFMRERDDDADTPPAPEEFAGDRAHESVGGIAVAAKQLVATPPFRNRATKFVSNPRLIRVKIVSWALSLSLSRDILVLPD